MLTHRVKICGLNSAEAVDAAVQAGADYLGFIHFSKSPRHVRLQTAAELAARKGGAKSVAVLVDPDDALLGEVLRIMRPDYIQLHGGETPQRCLDARHYAEHGVWKALGVSTPDNVAAAEAYENYVDGFVFDAKPPKHADRPGGLGQAWDYGLLKGIQTEIPWLLAGGLSIETVQNAMDQSGATRLDVVSGVETSPGVKDLNKIQQFITAVKTR
jgi:phosphoribosylanthranilate isomerase